MKWIMWFLRGILFLFLFGFAVKNDQLVILHFFFGAQWQLPLVFVILLFFAGGRYWASPRPWLPCSASAGRSDACAVLG